jgi:acyl-CoA synthetase (AMP-forming)/AMP-acid ligase II
MLSDRVAAHALRDPRGVAVRIDRGDRLSFGALDRRANRLARVLSRSGVGTGTPVAVLCCEHHATDVAVGYLGATRAGALPTVLPATLPSSVLAEALRLLDPAVVLACGEGVAAWRVTGQPARVIGDDPGVTWWKSAELHEPADPIARPAFDPEGAADVVAVLGTDGWELTTRTHAQVAAAARLPVAPGYELMLSGVPFDDAAAVQTALLGALASGFGVLLQTPFDADRVYRLLPAAATACLLPTQVDALPAGSHWVALDGLCWWTPADAHAEAGVGIVALAGA